MTLDHQIGALVVERLGPSDLPETFAFLDCDPVVNVYLMALVLRDALGKSRDEFWGVRRDGVLRGLLHLGGQTGAVLPVGDDPDALDLLADCAVARRGVLPQRFQAIGPRPAIRALARRLRAEGIRPRIDRDQVYMSLARGELSPFERLGELRRARAEDFDVLFESGSLLRAEELEEDPREVDSKGYRKRVVEECRDGHTYLWQDDHGLCFRASISAYTPDAAQVSGVYTPLDRRGQGNAKRGLAEMCTRLLERTRNVCLFVNDFNTPALAVYEHLGFRKVADWASAFYAPEA